MQTLQVKINQIILSIKKIIFKNCAPFVNYISRINNTQVDDADDIDVVMHNLIEYSENYLKTSGSLWQYCRDESALVDNTITDFNAANATTDSFKIKEKMTGQTGNSGTKNVEIMVPLKFLSNFWRTLEMALSNCETNLDINWSKNCIIVVTAVKNQGATFLITDTKLYNSVITLSTQDNANLLEQLKAGFKRTIIGININQKYQQKGEINI